MTIHGRSGNNPIDVDYPEPMWVELGRRVDVFAREAVQFATEDLDALLEPLDFPAPQKCSKPKCTDPAEWLLVHTCCQEEYIYCTMHTGFTRIRLKSVPSMCAHCTAPLMVSDVQFNPMVGVS
ncbi:hypothetical protein [Cryobacterium fucosi]|uniref:Uncharacterized protein n=1 Tax=Cryobacterium fucosi TaxID=1259157 RepID=A0A4R9BGX1_9MICO|nr:hypothetical protein [Cryobacterium fucosi]TFD83955.1 hypothetical protein E3T48_00050 [Cryobacterium fucosi]